MRFDLITIFPEFFGGPLDHGIVRRAREARLIETRICDLRSFTRDRHRTVDDRPFGGGEGMVMKPEPLFEAVESLLGGTTTRQASRRFRAQPLCCSRRRASSSSNRRHAALQSWIASC